MSDCYTYGISVIIISKLYTFKIKIVSSWQFCCQLLKKPKSIFSLSAMFDKLFIISFFCFLFLLVWIFCNLAGFLANWWLNARNPLYLTATGIGKREIQAWIVYLQSQTLSAVTTPMTICSGQIHINVQITKVTKSASETTLPLTGIITQAKHSQHKQKKVTRESSGTVIPNIYFDMVTKC